MKALRDGPAQSQKCNQTQLSVGTVPPTPTPPGNPTNCQQKKGLPKSTGKSFLWNRRHVIPQMYTPECGLNLMQPKGQAHHTSSSAARPKQRCTQQSTTSKLFVCSTQNPLIRPPSLSSFIQHTSTWPNLEREKRLRKATSVLTNRLVGKQFFVKFRRLKHF